MPARCPKVSFALLSVSREHGLLCIPWLKSQQAFPLYFEEPIISPLYILFLCRLAFRTTDAQKLALPQVWRVLAWMPALLQVSHVPAELSVLPQISCVPAWLQVLPFGVYGTAAA